MNAIKKLRRRRSFVNQKINKHSGDCALTDGHWSTTLLYLVEQEGQHPLTGQRAANFRLLANQ